MYRPIVTQWNETYSWLLDFPNSAFFRLSVYSRGLLKDELIGTETMPVFAMRMGYRSMSLRNAKGLRIQLASVLLRFHVAGAAFEPSRKQAARNRPSPAERKCSTVA